MRCGKLARHKMRYLSRWDTLCLPSQTQENELVQNGTIAVPNPKQQEINASRFANCSEIVKALNNAVVAVTRSTILWRLHQL